jgi:diaminohydroxyphosphoribosylaminopyrimidine deaminase/5-amino-6-(5-phosphoribosylamino)uracil reductase
VVRVTGGTEADRVRAALDELGALGVQSMLLEGGPHLAGAFLDAGEVDDIRLFVAPLVLGGRNARVPVEGRGVEVVAAARRALATDVERIGDDVLISSRLTEW